MEGRKRIPYRLDEASPPHQVEIHRASSRSRFLLVLLSLLGGLLALALLTVASYHLVYGQRIMLGVRVLDLDVGALEEAEARQLLAANLEVYLRSPLTLKQGGRQWKASPSELGASFDVNKTVARALAIGRGEGVLERFQKQASLMGTPQTVPLAFVMNEVALEGGLARLAREVEAPPVDASLKLVGAEVAISPSQGGYQIDRQALKSRLQDAFSVLSAAPVELPVRTLPPQIVEADLAQYRAQVERMLSGAVTVRHGERRWTLEQEALAQMLRLEQSKDAQGRPRWEARITPDKAEAWVKGLAKEIEQPAQDARLAWNSGRLTPISPSRPGLALDAPRFGEALNRALSQGQRAVELPVIAIKARVAVEDIPLMGIREKVAEDKTSFAGTFPDRIHNIRLGAQRINGKVLPPGGVYSMAETLGEISERTGYKLGFAIVGPDTVLDVGGGLSQLTTTVFKPAFWAGFPIIERHTHAYRIRRYEPVLGIEATVYPPAVDLKFKNDTDHYVLLEARTDGGDVYITFYGTRPNREVTIEGPIVENIVPANREVIRRETPLLPKGQEIISEAAEDGLDVTVYRIIKVDGKEVRRERFFNRFRPANNVILVGTKEEGKTEQTP